MAQAIWAQAIGEQGDSSQDSPPLATPSPASPAGAMVHTMLGRTAARHGALARVAAKAAPSLPRAALVPASRLIATSSARLGGDYDWNLGVPGSRIRNPDPEAYNDVYPAMGKGWWALIIVSTASFFWSHCYDTTRGVNIAIGVFGPNMPM
uniref:Uncharacterized protein n=1 Tax=Alexandrium monilatum TaxID=311494 RepID=A0A6T1G501_9DINO